MPWILGFVSCSIGWVLTGNRVSHHVVLSELINNGNVFLGPGIWSLVSFLVVRPSLLLQRRHLCAVKMSPDECTDKVSFVWKPTSSLVHGNYAVVSNLRVKLKETHYRKYILSRTPNSVAAIRSNIIKPFKSSTRFITPLLGNGKYSK